MINGKLKIIEQKTRTERKLAKVLTLPSFTRDTYKCKRLDQYMFGLSTDKLLAKRLKFFNISKVLSGFNRNNKVKNQATTEER